MSNTKRAEYRAIYTDLDSLVDTRITTIAVLYPEVFKKLIETKAYLKRVSDTIVVGDEIFDMKMVKSFYKNRKTKILEISPPTNIVFIVGRLLTDYYATMDSGNENRDFKLIVNTYPYELDEKLALHFHTKFRDMLEDACEIEFIYFNENEITIEMLKEYNVIDMIVYGGYEWLSKVIYRSSILESGNIRDMQLVSTRPPHKLSQYNDLLKNLNLSVLSDNHKPYLPIEDEKWIDTVNMVIRNQILDYSLFSYIDIEPDFV